MGKILEIELDYNDYCELDNELFNTLNNMFDSSMVRVDYYNNHITHYSFYDSVYDESFLSFDDKNHTITIYFGTCGLGVLSNRKGDHIVPLHHAVKFTQLPL